MLDHYNYQCPHCRSELRLDDQVRFKVENDKGQQAMLFLSPHPQDYNYSMEPALPLEKGEQLKFYCWSCETPLHQDDEPDFVFIRLKVSDEIKFDVKFSAINGEHSTFIRLDDEWEEYTKEFLSVHATS